MTKRGSVIGFVAMAMLGAGCGAADDGQAAGAQAVDTPPLQALPTSADFGRVTVGASTTLRITVSNTGTVPVDVASVTVVTAFPPDPCRAVLIQPCIRPGGSSTLEVTCAPTAASHFGGRVALSYSLGRESYVLSVPYSGDGY